MELFLDTPAAGAAFRQPVQNILIEQLKNLAFLKEAQLVFGEFCAVIHGIKTADMIQ